VPSPSTWHSYTWSDNPSCRRESANRDAELSRLDICIYCAPCQLSAENKQEAYFKNIHRNQETKGQFRFIRTFTFRELYGGRTLGDGGQAVAGRITGLSEQINHLSLMMRFLFVQETPVAKKKEKKKKEKRLYDDDSTFLGNYDIHSSIIRLNNAPRALFLCIFMEVKKKHNNSYVRDDKWMVNHLFTLPTLRLSSFIIYKRHKKR